MDADRLRNEAYVLPGYEEAAEQTELFYVSPFEVIKGFSPGLDPEEAIQRYRKIRPCTCGCGRPIAVESECMGDMDFEILCPACGRNITRTGYDFDIDGADACPDQCISDWNTGLSGADIKKRLDAEAERIRIREEDVEWKELYPNNMPDNGLSGYYMLLFRKNRDGSISGCKFTIAFQEEEIMPLRIRSGAPIEAYNLFCRRYFDVTGELQYPEPANELVLMTGDSKTFEDPNGVNDYGDFVRSYRTLEDAKTGALARLGWQGINRDTVISPVQE